MQITNTRKKQRHMICKFVFSWKQFLSADWLFTVHFAVKFQTIKSRNSYHFMFEFPRVAFSELFLGETVSDIVDLQTIIYHFSRSWVWCMLSKRISGIRLLIVSEMTDNPTAKYVKFWFCVTLSELFFRWGNRQHFPSGNDNLTFLSKLSLLYAFQVNFRHWFVYRERNNREPNGEVYKILVSCEPVD